MTARSLADVKHMISDGTSVATDAVIFEAQPGRQTLTLCLSRRKPDLGSFPSLSIVSV